LLLQRVALGLLLFNKCPAREGRGGHEEKCVK
jgi:hypothetical protein